MKRISAILTLAALFAADAVAQELNNDRSVRKGVLENGLTYYLCYNYVLDERADFYLVTAVGSMHENEEKAGITHLLEHLCFNGTGNFPGNGIETYCRNIGVHYGKDLNASTGRERTVHEICNVPVEEPHAIDSCLLILHDWATDVRISQETLDKEREIILQERRQRLDHTQRLDSLSSDFLYGDSPYGSNIIGTPETLHNISVDDVTDFYNTWYRPDNQAIIIVGDFDLNPMERKLQKIFGTLEKPASPIEREAARVPDFDAANVKVISDPEIISTNISMRWRSDSPSPEALLSMEGQRRQTLEYIVYRGLLERLEELFSMETHPFVKSVLRRASYGGRQEDIIISAAMSADVSEEAFMLMAVEMERMARHGLTESELNMIKADLTASYEQAARIADHRPNSYIASDCRENFLYGKPYFSPSAEVKMTKEILDAIDTESIRKTAADCLKGRYPLIICSVPEHELGLIPSEQAFLEILENTASAELPPAVTEDIPDMLMTPPAIPEIEPARAEGLNGTSELRYPNGLTVVLWLTNNGSKTIHVDMFKKGGRSRIPAEDLPSFESQVQAIYFENSGVATYPASVLKKKLKGKNVSAAPYINSLSHGITADADTKDMEEMFQLINMYWTSPRFEQAALDKSIGILKPLAVNNAKNPDSQISRLQQSVFYSDTSRQTFFDEALVEKVNLESLERNYKTLFDGARGAVAVIMGDFKWMEIKPLIDQYLGTLPYGNFSQCDDNGNGYADGSIYKQFGVKRETPNTRITHRIHLELPEYSYETLVGLKYTEYILNKRLDDNLRERQGGTYSVSVSSYLSPGPSATARLTITFECSPNMTYFLSKLTKKEVQTLAKYGPTYEELAMAKSYLDKDLQDSAVTVNYWMEILREHYLFNINNHSGYMFAMLQMSPEEIAAHMIRICSSPNYAEVIIHPSGH